MYYCFCQISSPADPALLLFKLNKLQAAQSASATQSASTSPQLPFSTSPNSQLPPRFQGRHGQSLSLAQPPSFQSAPYNAVASFNPFGPNAILGSDAIFPPTANMDSSAKSDPGAPTEQSLAPPALPLRADSRPDFVRGFGIDIPEEEEPLEDEGAADISRAADETLDMSLDEGRVEVEHVDEDGEDQGSVTTAPLSRLHSRHVSRLSAALSLLSVGGLADAPLNGGHTDDRNLGPDVDDLDREAVGEWTGSEDLRTGAETTEDEVRNSPSRDKHVFERPLFCRRASGSGPIHLMKSARGRRVFRGGSCANLSTRYRRHAACPISLIPRTPLHTTYLTTATATQSVKTTCSPIRVKKKVIIAHRVRVYMGRAIWTGTSPTPDH